MPQHVRTQIRLAVAEALKGLPTTGDRVFVSRVYPLEGKELPGLIVMTFADEVDISRCSTKDGNLILWSKLQLMVKAFVKNTVNVDGILDQIENEVRKKIMTDYGLNELVKDINWQSTEIELSSAGDIPIGIAEILFIINYRRLNIID